MPKENNGMPMLFPVEPEDFWQRLRAVIQEELRQHKPVTGGREELLEIKGLTEKPLYKISEICSLFSISRPTVYDWIKEGKLRPVKIRSRVYFLGKEVRGLMGDNR